MSEDFGARKSSKGYAEFRRTLGADGFIDHTSPSGGIGDGSFDRVLTPFRRPPKPLDIDTPEKKAKWEAYWSQVEAWWEAERQDERRSKW